MFKVRKIKIYLVSFIEATILTYRLLKAAKRHELPLKRACELAVMLIDAKRSPSSLTRNEMAFVIEAGELLLVSFRQY